MEKSFLCKIFVLGLCALSLVEKAGACTGISFFAKDSSRVVARTIEWGGSNLNSQYVIVPRNYAQQSYTPEGANGMTFTSRYGYVGFSVEQKEFVAEGLNEAGLSAGLFYFPGYGEYEAYKSEERGKSVADLQLVSWVLSSFSTVDEVIKAIEDVHVIAIDPRASTVHWRFIDATGRQVVLEFVKGKPFFYENKLGVLTNSPGFEWQMTNLNNYVNLFPGTAPLKEWENLTLSSFGAGSGFLGLPGDVTPPSRFVRAAFYQITAPHAVTGKDAILQAFQILNNFDIPVGIEHAEGEAWVNLPSATQWTAATDITARKIYYRTAWNSTIRCFDLKKINFSQIDFRAVPMDIVKEQPIIEIAVE